MTTSSGSRLRIELTLPADPDAKGPVDWTLYLWPCKAARPSWERVEDGTADDWTLAVEDASEAITVNFVEE